MDYHDQEALPALFQEDEAHQKELPKSLAAERAVLGALLINEHTWELVANRLFSSDFFFEPHRLIFTAMERLAARSQPLDAVLVNQELADMGKLDAVGGEAYVRHLFEETPSFGSNVVYFSATVRDKSMLRELIRASGESMDEAYLPKGKQAETILEAAEKRIFAITNRYRRDEREGFRSAKVLAAEAIRHLQVLAESGNNGVTGISTGFSQLDQLTAGLQPGELIIVAGRPSMGKTTFAMNIAESVALNSKLPVAVFSLEMPARSLMLRLFSSLGQIEQNAVRTGKLNQMQQHRLQSAVQQLRQAQLFIDDTSSLDVMEIRARARRLYREQGGLGLVLVDYLQLIQPDNSSENRVTQMSNISRALKLLAKELNVPIIALSQLNRGLEQRDNRRPRMSDIRDSGAIEQDADLIMFVYRDEVYDENNPAVKGIAEIIIGKQRNGGLGTVKLKFEGQHLRFSDLPNIPPLDYEE